MATYDLRLDVPGRAYLNAQLLSLLEQGGTLWDAKKHLFSLEPYVRTFRDEDVYRYKPHDHSLAISLLFCTIVVPREFLDLPADHQMYRDFDAGKVTKSFVVTTPPNIDSYRFIRCLRNSVAHALFSIREQNGEVTYEFWTERDPLFRATVGHRDLLTFMSVVGVRLSNAVLSQK